MAPRPWARAPVASRGCWPRDSGTRRTTAARFGSAGSCEWCAASTPWPGSMALKEDLQELFPEGRAGVECRLEVLLLEAVHLDGLTGYDGRVPGLAGHQRDLAEKPALLEHRYHVPRYRVGDDHVDAPRSHHIEFVTGIALANQDRKSVV